MLCCYHFQRRFLLAVPSHAFCYVLRMRLAAFVIVLHLVLQAKDGVRILSVVGCVTVANLKKKSLGKTIEKT